jgi:predicted acetyltransferase
MKTNLKLIKATLEQKPILANLLELYAYDFTEHCDFDIGDNGFYGYPNLSTYWSEPNKHPYLILVDSKIAGLALIQKGSPIDNKLDVWDMAEFFVMKKYKRHGIGTTVALKIWEQFNGPWQIRVLTNNSTANKFWLHAIKTFSPKKLLKTKVSIKNDDWVIYTFESKDISK